METAKTLADLVITGGTIVTDQAGFRGAVAVKDGRILAVGADESMPAARETFDATGLHLLPVAIGEHKNLVGMALQNIEDRPERGNIRKFCD